MEFNTRSWTIDEYRFWLKRITAVLFFSVITCFLLVIKVISADEKIILRTPGMEDTVFSKNSLDVNSMKAIAIALSHNVADLNRGNYENQIKAIESWFAPEVATKIAMKIKQIVKKQIEQHEAGTQFFEFNPGPSNNDEYEYDPELDMHFVRGRLHFINAAKDDIRPIVFAFKFKVTNYLPKATEFHWEFGDVIKNSKWLENQRRNRSDLVPANEWNKNQDLNAQDAQR
jgi:hypothetical protein